MRKRTILCVDDYEACLIARKILLEDEGYEVLTAPDGRSGLQLFQSHSVDVVILDYQMPGMNGDVVACQMKTLKPEVPILLLSAHHSLPEEKLKFIDVFVSKDESVQVLSAAVRELLSRFSGRSVGGTDWQDLLSRQSEPHKPVRDSGHDQGSRMAAWPAVDETAPITGR